MNSDVRLGRVFGVRVGLHYSWFLIAGLLFVSLAPMLRRSAPDWAPGLSWPAAATTTALFFVGLLAHELAHAAAARLWGVPVREITLFALGGIAQAGGEAPSPKAEFWIGAVGPLASAVIGGLCLGGAALLDALRATPSLAQGALAWLGAINLGIAAFNLLPAYPLDGGRLLRAAAWAWTGSRDRATLVAARCGQAVALCLIFWGALRFLAGAGLGGLWLAFIGWFLLNAATTSALDIDLRRALSGLRVGELMRHELPSAEAGEDLEAAAERLSRGGRATLVVRDAGRWVGVLTAREVGRVPRRRRHATRVRDAALPPERARALPPGASALDALELMASEGLEELPVVDAGALAGMVSRDDIVRALRARRELGGSRG